MQILGLVTIRISNTDILYECLLYIRIVFWCADEKYPYTCRFQRITGLSGYIVIRMFTSLYPFFTCVSNMSNFCPSINQSMSTLGEEPNDLQDRSYSWPEMRGCLNLSIFVATGLTKKCVNCEKVLKYLNKYTLTVQSDVEWLGNGLGLVVV